MADSNNNLAVINAAFERLRKRMEEKAEVTMVDVLKKAVDYALESHDDEHRNHLLVGDTYGWALVHNNAIIKSEVRTGKNNEGNVKASLAEMAASLGKKGYVGIVMAGMNPTNYFAVDYEMDILEDAADFTRETFKQQFKQL